MLSDISCSRDRAQDPGSARTADNYADLVQGGGGDPAAHSTPVRNPRGATAALSPNLRWSRRRSEGADNGRAGHPDAEPADRQGQRDRERRQASLEPDDPTDDDGNRDR